MNKIFEKNSMNKTVLSSFATRELLNFLICVLICLVCKLSVLSGIKYYLFQLCAISVPGLAIYLLLKSHNNSSINIMIFSYVFGIAVLMIEYLLIMLLNIRSYALVVSLVVLVVSVYLIIRNKSRLSYIIPDRDYYLVYGINILITLICFFYLSYSYVSPEKYGGTAYDKDFLYWIGNSISFVKGLPVQDFRLYGENYYYHYFSNIVIAQTNLITNIDIVEISYFFSYIIPCWLLSLGTYSFLKAELKSKYLVFIGMILILMTDGLTSYLHDHLYFCPFGFDYGYAISMISFMYVCDMYKNNRYKWNDIIVSCTLLILATGFKGPNGLIVLMSYGLLCLVLLIERKWKISIGLGVLWLLCFIFVYCVFLSDILHPEKETNGLLILGLLGSFDVNPFGIKILNKLIDIGFPDNGLSRIISLLAYIVLNDIGAMVLLAIGVGALVYTMLKKQKDAVLFTLVGTSIGGILLTNITHQDGNSQMYFIMAVIPFCVLSGLYAINTYIRQKKVVISLLVFISIVSISDVFRFVDNCVYSNINNSITLQSGGIIEEDRRYFFTEEEYALAKWIKNNTDQYDLVALDCFEYDKKRKEVMMGVFSERFIWDDGQYSYEKEKLRRRELVSKAVDGDAEALEKLKNENVKYIIQTLSQNPDLCIKSEKVYNSDGYVVYRIK